MFLQGVSGAGRLPRAGRCYEELGRVDGAVDISGASDVDGAASDGAVLRPGSSDGDAVVGEQAARTPDARRRKRISSRFMQVTHS